MRKVIIKGEFTILGKIKVKKKDFSFNANIPNQPVITVNMNISENQIESIQEAEVSEKLLARMKKDEYNNLPEGLDLELANICSGVSIATRRVMGLIKYCLSQSDIDEALFSSKGVFWSEDGKTWNRISRRLRVAISVSGIMPLDDKTEICIQDFLDSDYQPFLALRHLQRARNERNPRHKWIDATIAAELAIKEFLIRIKPELETLLLEVPSPPMHKMYGPILNEYAGEPLNREILASLAKGAEIRNKLLHRPQEEIIDHQKAINYVDNVAEAIKFLVTILYPTKMIIV